MKYLKDLAFPMTIEFRMVLEEHEHEAWVAAGAQTAGNVEIKGLGEAHTHLEYTWEGWEEPEEESESEDKEALPLGLVFIPNCDDPDAEDADDEQCGVILAEHPDLEVVPEDFPEEIEEGWELWAINDERVDDFSYNEVRPPTHTHAGWYIACAL
jgi:hypothetical protein